MNDLFLYCTIGLSLILCFGIGLYETYVLDRLYCRDVWYGISASMVAIWVCQLCLDRRNVAPGHFLPSSITHLSPILPAAVNVFLYCLLLVAAVIAFFVGQVTKKQEQRTRDRLERSLAPRDVRAGWN